MSAISLQALIGTALTDSSFRKALLNGSRRQILSTFRLTQDEIEGIMKIQADSLEQFACALHQQFLASSDDLEPLVRHSSLALRKPIKGPNPPHEEYLDDF